MNPADAAELLTLAAAFDRRTVGKSDAIAWADALSGLDKGDCAEAVRAHFRDSTEYLMPAHVRQGVRRIRAERVRIAGNAEPDYDRDDVLGGLRAIRNQRRAIANGHLAPAATVVPDVAGQKRVEREMRDALGKLPQMPEASRRPRGEIGEAS